MAFRVPQELWDILTTKKITTKPASAPGAGDGEGFEFRWTGGQSVLPPSVHPDTGRPYEWWVDAMESVADMPIDMLTVWAGQLSPKQAASPMPEVKLEDLNEQKVAEVNRVLEIVKSRHPTLSYDDWCSVAWGVAKELGREAGEVIMREYYPEQEPGEYRNIYRNYNAGKSPSMGTVIKMYAGLKSKKEQHAVKYQEYLSAQEELQQLEKRIRELKNGKRN
jgi:alpha-L-fucosidase